MEKQRQAFELRFRIGHRLWQNACIIWRTQLWNAEFWRRLLLYSVCWAGILRKNLLGSVWGSSGPAIGGLNNAESLQAAETLKKLIEESEEVADYQYEGYYQDLDLKINMGIKNDVPYYNEEPCDEIPDLQ